MEILKKNLPKVNLFNTLFVVGLSVALCSCINETNHSNQDAQKTQEAQINLPTKELAKQKKRMALAYYKTLMRYDEINKTKFTKEVNVSALPDSEEAFNKFYNSVGAPANQIENYRIKYIKTDRFVLLLFESILNENFDIEHLPQQLTQTSIPNTKSYIVNPDGTILLLMDDYKIKNMESLYINND